MPTNRSLEDTLALMTIRLRYETVAMRLQLNLREVRDARLELHYSPDQPHVPAGSPDGGQWTGDETTVRLATSHPRHVAALGGYNMGRLVTQFMTSDGRRCVYQFDFGTIVVPGPNNLSCSPITPSAAVEHGHRLNDN
jgi:hypothetical protein